MEQVAQPSVDEPCGFHLSLEPNRAYHPKPTAVEPEH